ncbi:dynein associated protein-domain-containing protein [Daldinia vernicosa]|uniref:dynein associated protein-domain-containing protein n=1 Tax=Daldinia vernicosa TaxID=114800 RepID=UPI0020079C08|nr:dynein associated protein-domain-containing protein [Daldinia vernicosa]KAI0845781.1 dynein associated protein-domain-containing protein [Daldinia vernicosa]
MSDVEVGQTIRLTDGRNAIVRYVGQTHFAVGDWIGIELEDDGGKNDGSVQGERYFDCSPGRGMFVRPNTVAAVLQPAPPTRSAAPPQRGPRTGTAARRPSSVTGRPSSVAGRSNSMTDPSTGTGKRMSLNAPSPSPVPRRSSSSRPSSMVRVRTAYIAYTNISPPLPSAGNRRQVSTPPNARVSTAPARASRSTAGRGGNGSDLGSPFKSDGEQTTSPLTSTGPSSATSSKQPASTASSKAPPSAAASTRTSATSAARENEDLKAKLKIKELELIQEQRDKFESINKKIEGKYQSTAQENSALRKQLKEAEERLTVMELATLDREMAEETAEELELEVEGMSPDERASTGWLQMERHNERLQQEEESKAQIKALEKDLEDFEAIKEQYQIAKEKLLESEARAEDLRQQLDDNAGAESMIEQLSYEKLQQSEHIKELKAMIEDLEALKEINDELEVNHVQNEKEMQDELDFKDSIIAEQGRRASEKDDTIGDLEYTLSRFRELVTNLQTDLEDMRASHAVNEAESEQLNSKSRAMMDLNQKLQLSAVKTQIKTIDLELQRMDAQEAQQHLQIVKLFLPESYNTDKDSVLALLRFSRLAFKANLLHGFVKERVNKQPHPGLEDDALAGCDALDKLTWVSSMCDRFVNAISHCSLEEFAKYEGALYELEPVERALNTWIDGLRRDELKEKQCASELQRTIALMTHLGEVHISQGLESFADEMQMKTVLMQSHLESAATAFNIIKDMVQRVVPPNGDEDELAQHFAKKSEAVITQTRSAKVIISKAVRSLEDLRARSLALTPDTAEAFEECEAASQELAEMSRKIGVDLHRLLNEEGRDEPFTYPEVQSAVHNTIMTAFSSAESDLFSTYLSKLRTLTGQVTDLAAVCADLSQTQEFERSQAPWLLRAQELKALKTIPIDAEEELRQLKEHYNEARRTIALRDENLSTAALRIETLEARMRDANAKASRMADLEAQLADAQKLVESLKKDIEQQDREAKTLEVDRDKWKKIAGDSRAFGDETGSNGSRAKAGQERAVATAREMDALKNDIASLQAAIRYLREDNRRARATEQARHDWLAEPLQKPVPVVEQRKALVAAEGRDALGELLRLATSAKVYDLSTLPKDKMAWRPAKATPQYHAAKQAEDYATWNSWQGSVIQKTRVVLTAEQGRKKHQESDHAKMMRKAAARLQIRLPDADGKVIPGVGAREVQIVGSREWEGLQGRLAAAM